MRAVLKVNECAPGQVMTEVRHELSDENMNSLLRILQNENPDAVLITVECSITITKAKPVK